ncbi:hypothetical protein [Brevundimonas sp. SL161]|uniref:hypothetical protein n=1 Tax=Brevundimonas sp. SL161 TaxID=2804613 RepID=UPI003CED0AC4
MRIAALAAALAATLTAAGLSPARAQDALDATGELRIAAVGQTRVVMVQGVSADPLVWEWSFLDEEVTSDEGMIDAVAMSVMYDCAARTRRPLALEAYRDGAFVSQSPVYEEPAPVAPGTLVDGALEVVCEPDANSDGAAFPNMAAARAAMDVRKGPVVTPP